jgi:hypothetical protein
MYSFLQTSDTYGTALHDKYFLTTLLKLLFVPLFGQSDTQVSNPYKAAIEIKINISVFTF